MSDREGVKIFLENAEKAQFDELHKALGMTQKEAATRVFRWFIQQPDAIQRGVLGVLPPDMEADIARLVLEKMASGDLHSGFNQQPRMAAQEEKPKRGGYTKKNKK